MYLFAREFNYSEVFVLWLAVLLLVLAFPFLVALRRCPN